jgi:7-cyano-7-deazaguanine reductase
MNEFEYDPKTNPRLETIENPEQGRKYDIEFTIPEWTALCPRSGFPDFGIMQVKYQPRKHCVELKSLKLYINSYRDVGIFHEAAVNKILTDMVEALQPWKMEVIGDFNVRGNIKTIIRAGYTAPDYQP